MPSTYKKRISASAAPLWRQMLLFFLPILFGSFFQQLYNTADAVIVGRFVGKEALASVGGCSGTIINLLVGFFMGLSGGATVIIAQCFGANDRENLSRAVHTGMALAVVGGGVCSVIGAAMSGTALRWMGTPADILPLAEQYMVIYFCGLIPNLVYNIGAGILRAVGDSRRPLMFLIVTCFVNIVLDLIFVAWLHMGVPGVALATILSQTVSAVLTVAVLMRTEDVYKLELKKIRFHGRTLRRIIAIGIPAGVQSSMYAISNVFIQATVNSFGTDTVAAWAAFGKLDSLNWMLSGAFGTTVATFAGQSFGAGDYTRMKRSAGIGALMNVISSLLLASGMFLGGRYAMMLFTKDAGVLEVGMVIIRYMVSFYGLFIPVEILSAMCRSAGDTLRPMLITATGICVYRMIWIFTVLSRWHKLELLLVCYPISWLITGAAFFIYYKRSNWLHRMEKI